jgi:hypothetical protein
VARNRPQVGPRNSPEVHSDSLEAELSKLRAVARNSCAADARATRARASAAPAARAIHGAANRRCPTLPVQMSSGDPPV